VIKIAVMGYELVSRMWKDEAGEGKSIEDVKR
jgi:hypothetical protein